MNPAQHMRDPASGVSPSLLPHMHLVSKHRYPVNNNPSLETIVSYLIEAPKIVRDLAPVQWQFLEAPMDGTLMLTWQPVEHNATHFASDGYIYGDAEQSTKSDVRGYTLESFHQRSGYRAGEAVASHSRRRYRLLPSNPSMPPVDPSLFIIHYSKAHGRDTIPAASIPVHPHVAQQMNQRRAIQAQGQLARKEFMLHDRSNWPQIHAPAGMGRGGQGHRRGTSVGNETSVEEDEDVSRGDILDFMTPREISRMRYEQHHEWMEEILESPYNIHQIIPGDLGLGRKGELEKLTKDFFDAPTTAMRETSGSSGPARVGKMDQEKADDFKKRAAEKIAEMQAEIDGMKARHAARISKMRRTTILNSAERRLRSAPTASNERSMSSGSMADHHDVNALDEIAGEVESNMGKKIERVANMKMVSQGGLQERHNERTFSTSSTSKPAVSPIKATASPAAPQSGFTQAAQNGLQQQTAQVQAQPLVGTRTESSSTSGAGAGEQSRGSQAVSEDNILADDAGMGEGELPPLDDVRMDVDMEGLVNDADEDDATPAGNDWVMVDDQATENMDENVQEATAQDSKLEEGDEATKQADETSAATNPTSAQPNMLEQTADDQGMDDNEFGAAFDSVDVDTAGDALAGYGDGDDDLNLDVVDDSAFGDAFHPDDDGDIS